MKYEFRKYLRMSVPLPADINDSVEKDIAQRFRSLMLIEQMTKWREKRRFGEMSFLSKDGKLACSISYQAGIAHMYYLILRVQSEEGVIEQKWSNKNVNLIYDKKTHKREKE